MEVWNPILWEFSRVMRECHRKVGTMLARIDRRSATAPSWGRCARQDGLTQAELSERLPAE